MRRKIPPRLFEENEHLTNLWLNSDMSFEEIVNKYGTEQYKEYKNAQDKRKQRLLELGIIED